LWTVWNWNPAWIGERSLERSSRGPENRL
jgi:hypothetical protein